MNAPWKLCVTCGAHIRWEPEHCFSCRLEGKHRQNGGVPKRSLREELLDFRDRNKITVQLDLPRRSSRRVYVPGV